MARLMAMGIAKRSAERSNAKRKAERGRDAARGAILKEKRGAQSGTERTERTERKAEREARSGAQ